MDIRIINRNSNGLSDQEIINAIKESLQGSSFKHVLIIPPDITRFHSKAGFITNQYYHQLKDIADIDILPALGTHFQMSEDECKLMFGDIPYIKFIYHDWRNDVVNIGEAPVDYVKEVTKDLWNEKVDFEINKLIIEGNYDLILSIGQVVPHEVIGMANHSKNILVGCGGKNTINQSHMVGAVFGMEKMMGKDNTPVRKILDYGLTHFLSHLPIVFVLTVTTAVKDNVSTHGLFIGPKRSLFEDAIDLSQEMNINFLDKPIKKCIVYLNPKEFKSTWLGNKSIYRTRMAIEDNGELIILGEGIKQFGEDKIIDMLIRKYGYYGRKKILKSFAENKDLQMNMSAAAHLIHGSSDNRFKISYAVKHLSTSEIENVNYNYLDFDDTIKVYNPNKLKTGWNKLDNGEEVFFIPNPALGLWIDKNKFNQ